MWVEYDGIWMNKMINDCSIEIRSEMLIKLGAIKENWVKCEKEWVQCEENWVNYADCNIWRLENDFNMKKVNIKRNNGNISENSEKFRK